MTITTQGTWPLSNRDSNAYWSLLPDSLGQMENELLHSFARPPATIEWENQRREHGREEVKEEQRVQFSASSLIGTEKDHSQQKGELQRQGVSFHPAGLSRKELRVRSKNKCNIRVMCVAEISVPISESEINTAPNSFACFLRLLTFYSFLNDWKG